MSAPDDIRRVDISFVDGVAQIPEKLWTECFPPPLEGRFWYETLETSGLEDQFRFLYALISRDGRPLGIAPCFVHNVPIHLVAPPAVAFLLRKLSRIFPQFGYQRTFFVGSPCSDQGDIGLLPGTELAHVIGGLRDAVAAKAAQLEAPMIVFKDVPQPYLAAIRLPCDDRPFVETVSFPGCIVSLTGPDKAAFYRALSHNQRHNMLKKLRRSREILALETTVVSRPSERELDEIFGLFSQTYERGRTKFERLGLPFFRRISRQEPAEFILQRERDTGELVAFMLVFCIGDRLINKFIGLNYRRAGNTFLYFRLFDAALDLAYARGAKELQSGQTGYRAKLSLGHRIVPLFNVFRHEHILVHSIFKAIGKRVTWRSLDPDLAGIPEMPHT